MLYATSSDSYHEVFGHVGSEDIARILNNYYSDITEIQADGDELVKCCDILGRKLPSRPVYTFLGINAMEIAKNWDSK